MLRLFVAIPLSETIQQDIALLHSGVPNARWVRPENMHVTISFLGDVAEMSVDSLDHVLGTINVEPFPLRVQGIGHFGTRRKVHALWIGVDGGDQLMRLHGKIDRAVRSLGLEPDGRKFQPHVTLARLRDAPLNRVTRYMTEHNLYKAPDMTADRFTLFKSTLGRAAAQYDALKTYELLENS